MKFLRFESEAAALSALAEFLGPQQQWPAYIRSAAVDVVGVVYRQTGGVLQTSYGPVPELAPKSGWHINLSERVPELQQHEIEPPATPDRVFAGLDMAPPLRIPSEVARWQAKLILMRTPSQNGSNLWDELMAMRAAMPDSENSVLLDAALLEVLNWRRTSPTVEWAAQQLGLSSAQVDELFIAAAALEL